MFRTPHGSLLDLLFENHDRSHGTLCQGLYWNSPELKHEAKFLPNVVQALGIQKLEMSGAYRRTTTHPPNRISERLRNFP